MILHLIKASPFSSQNLNQCLQEMAENDGLLLIQDAVLAVTGNQSWHTPLKSLKHFYVLEEDLQARGIAEAAIPFRRVDYQRFVALTLEFDKVRSWI
ncbi:sulfurtransferase complex subunit TusB [Bowmanella dokdonensis]|uniref:Sulfurtransferase complex subunit TusB n=1 Tax=Bowmanella dokdonensis TaxID=751969 RepID=A0A939DKY0_9ALTE|nr:sulfurtransferase complex subunit TusB [Bowmanella dokdonensis]MBN7824465.1 sulfurtransferase complex subunit TusB [Bowmanella dokdonensis]